MLIGYARVSTTEQDAGFEAQRRELAVAGCEEFFCEKVSSVAERQQLKECLRFIRKGDTLVVTKLDRLARSMRDLIEIVDQVKEKGAELRILAMNLDTSNATGELMLNVLGSVAQFERSMMLERQREGIAKAKAEGKFKGRAPSGSGLTITPYQTPTPLPPFHDRRWRSVFAGEGVGWTPDPAAHG